MIKVIDPIFTIDSDKYNWILKEKKVGKKVKLHFFSSIKQLARFVGDYKLRELLVKGKVDLLDKSSETPSYDSVINQTVLKLEQYVESLVDGDDFKR